MLFPKGLTFPSRKCLLTLSPFSGDSVCHRLTRVHFQIKRKIADPRK
uniref:Uncharacterized protein n=1 Tax=Utricularia reniformis TaxID=192314 RepID=A0A1Y0B0L3_9LAMI|nr:hypothetical protein AEK19_MT0753 [Utricularia reniformis]ART30996.1 hypothetical protein AEK19_MT0753 [Utricularia reniformis]